MRLFAKTIAVATTVGAAIVFVAPAASGQPALLHAGAPFISGTATINNDIAVIHVAETISSNSSIHSLTEIDVSAGGTAADQPDTDVTAKVTLPVEQHVVDAHNTETGYRVELLPTNGNGNASGQPLDADAPGAAVGSPGVISGNVIQVPIQIPINLCGNTIDIVGLLNPTFGNTCVNAD